MPWFFSDFKCSIYQLSIALRRLRASNQVDEDIDEMRAEEIAQRSESTISMKELCKSKTLRSPLIISVVMQLSQQLSGINAVITFKNVQEFMTLEFKLPLKYSK